ncbi:polysaccharide pyruvyl transferase family protein [Cobetia amphilecti]|uniref:polysaccharide pyruvyl transferase family protein n=1 Tax=Cobetia amphilecti TaxID=1055104 RepID=UPI0029432DAA|nr:polysaccharide pyruvyl transferase family protein [Cobetia amphilecti]WOI24902.1 polysaccharide pyruvyl transferase family protein [Cobetia amphilecti]|tara:strand:+ start:8076 stop:8909 length:834 start_codon:yes stop_codon:yes gene_type:complete
MKNLAFWWRDPNSSSYNLGDEITRIIFKEYYGFDLKKVSIERCDFISTGSILNWLPTVASKKTKKTYVLGSGFMNPEVDIELVDSLVKAKKIDFKFVRGYFTKSLLPISVQSTCSVGDPGLLLYNMFSPVYQTKEDNNAKVGLIPHHSQMNNEWVEKVLEDKNIELIDIRTDSIQDFVDELRKYKYIVSQSLHGLIFCDALLIPNVWLRVKALHKGGDFKFHDYFSSINRDHNKFITHESLSSPVDIVKNLYIPDSKIISERANDIDQSLRNFIKEK